MTDPYTDWAPPPPPPDRPPNPAQPSHVLSSRCEGYQLDSDGIITHTVWRVRVKFDGELGGDGVERYWTDGDGGFVTECPRIDRAVCARPWSNGK